MFIASKELTSCLWFFLIYLIRLLAVENSFIFFLWFTDRLCLLEKGSSILDRLEIKDPFIPLLVLFLGFRYVSGCIRKDGRNWLDTHMNGVGVVLLLFIFRTLFFLVIFFSFISCLFVLFCF
jgi:hypothetical protein